MRLWSLSSILFAVAVSIALPAAAESPPPGSYQGTCTNIKVQKLLGGPGKNLTATCQKKSGKPVDAVLALPCGGDIRNENGSLVCKSGPNPFAPPPGSYMAQCKNADMAGPILRASVQGERRVARRHHHQHARLPWPRHQREAERKAHLQVRRRGGALRA